MLNRRHIRIKVLQALYAYVQSENQSYKAGEKELMHSVHKMYDLYILYLQFIPELKRFAIRKMEERKRKIIPSEQDLNPSLNFINLYLFDKIDENISLRIKSEELKLDWVGDVSQDLVKKVFNQIEQNDDYQAFLAIDNPDAEQQKQFFVKLFKQEVCNSRILLNHFEEERIHWQDDFDHVFSMVIKTIKTFKPNSDETHEILPLFKDDEEEFMLLLFKKSIVNYEDHVPYLAKYTKNWESDRLAKMDTLIMNLAMTEAKEFRSIPLKVTLNEYIEISKYYSTPKSNTFINGVLDKVFADLQKDGDINKIGRGLI